MGSMHLGLEAVDPDGSMLAAFYAERAAGGAGADRHRRLGGQPRRRRRRQLQLHQRGRRGRRSSRRSRRRSTPPAAACCCSCSTPGATRSRSRSGCSRSRHRPCISPYSRCEPRALSEEEILATIEDFARGAARARELGFDGVEIMGSEGYLLSQFMAPATNLREDDWGGDAERRMRFPLAVAAAVREAAGPDGAVVYRISGADLVPGRGGGRGRDRAGKSAGQRAGRRTERRDRLARVARPDGAVGRCRTAPGRRGRGRCGRRWSVPVIASNRVNTAALADALVGRRAMPTSCRWRGRSWPTRCSCARAATSPGGG